MKKQLLVVLVVIVVLSGAILIGTTINWSGISGVAASLFSKQSPDHDDVVMTGANKLDGQELFGQIMNLNHEIDRLVSENEKTTDSVSSGKTNSSSANATEADSSMLPPDIGASVISATNVLLLPDSYVDTEEVDDSTGAQDQEKMHTPSVDQLILARKTLMLLLAKKDPQLFLIASYSSGEKPDLSPTNEVNIEKEVTVEGKITVLHYDDFEHHENSRFEYFLRVDGQNLALYPTEDIVTTSGETYKVTGKRMGNVIVANNQNIHRVAPIVNPYTPRGNPESVGEQRTLVMLISFLDSPTPLLSPSSMHELVFNGRINNFYREQSYNQTYFSGDVTDWNLLPRNGSMNVDTNEIESVVLAEQLDLGNYDRILVVLNGFWSGYGTVGKIPLFINGVEHRVSIGWTGIPSLVHVEASNFDGHILNQNSLELSYFDFVASHELGHNLGVMHANAFDCGAVSLRGDCNHIEYGNVFDTMGTGRFANHFNAFYKEKLGWVQPQNMVTISQSGRYTINNLEAPRQAGDSSVKNFAKIQRTNSTRTPFYLEFRRPVGFDSILNRGGINRFHNISGLFVNHIVNTRDELYSFPRLLDMEPTSLWWFDDVQRVTLNNGRVFRDDVNAVQIGPYINIASSSVTFDVTVDTPTCIRNLPRVDQIYYSEYLAGGFWGEVYFQFSNGDTVGCGDSNFDVKIGLPGSWTVLSRSPSGDMLLEPSDSDFTRIFTETIFRVPHNTRVGRYRIPVIVKNKASEMETVNSVTINVVTRPQIVQVTPSSGLRGQQITIQGNYFSQHPVVHIDHPTIGYRRLPVTSDGSTLQFTVPNQIVTYDCPGDPNECYVNTPSGDYFLYIHDENEMYSNIVDFEIR